jgi:5-methylcytosine-specific restriction endonuclease McrA
MIIITEYSKIETLYYEDIANRKYQKYGNKTLEKIYKEKFEDALGCDLKTLLCSSFDTLIKIKLPSTIEVAIKEIFNYQGKYQKPISDIFKEHIDLHTCYYCNIDFVNVFKATNKHTKSGYTLDHVKPKEQHPHLALSLYNFVPSCYVCNAKLKKDRDIGDVSPTASNFDFDAKVKFKTFMQNKDLQIENEEDFKLLLKEDFSNIYNQYIDVFELNGRYEYHKYKVIEMISKRKQYPDSRIRELADLTQKTEEDVRQDLFGEYFFEDNGLNKRPLSKLTKDIANELGLI